MGIIDYLRTTFLPALPASAEGETAEQYQAGPGQLPAQKPVKAPARPTALPSFKTQVAKGESAVQREDRRLASSDIVGYRTSADSRKVLRDLAATSPDLAGTRSSYLRVGIPEKYSVLARDLDGEINPEATRLAQEILRSITFLGDATLGYNPVTDLQSLSESLGLELVTYGAMGLELALDKQRSPLYLTPVSVTKIKFREEDGGVYPFQEIGGEEFSLDIPTFFYLSLDQDLLTPYAASYFEPAIQSVLADAQFLNDLRRSMVRSIHPRLVAEIIEEKVKASLDPAILEDAEELTEFYGNLIRSIQSTLSGLQPEDAIVSFDFIKYSTMEQKGHNIAETLSTVQKLLESKLAAGAKTMPAIMGRADTGTSATTSTMLFLKNADVVRRKLNVLYSRMLTQAVRLMAHDVFVEFRYDDIDLRPQAELEAYKSMKQSRVLELLSIGFLTDEAACVELTGNLPPVGFKPLSGTMFKAAAPAIAANPDSQTSNMGGAKDNLKPDTPAQPKGNAK